MNAPSFATQKRFSNCRFLPRKKDEVNSSHFLGTPDRIRTYGLRLRKPTLYPAELRVLTAPLL